MYAGIPQLITTYGERFHNRIKYLNCCGESSYEQVANIIEGVKSLRDRAENFIDRGGVSYYLRQRCYMSHFHMIRRRNNSRLPRYRHRNHHYHCLRGYHGYYYYCHRRYRYRYSGFDSGLSRFWQAIRPDKQDKYFAVSIYERNLVCKNNVNKYQNNMGRFRNCLLYIIIILLD